MRLRFPRGRARLVLSAVLAALLVPAAVKVVPDGSYKIVVKALKAGGNANTPTDWETWTSPTITIDRP